MAYKLIEAAQNRWRKVNAPELVALMRSWRGLSQRQVARTAHRYHTHPVDADDKTAGSEVA